jgi:small-conductance mechanosensitive channel
MLTIVFGINLIYLVFVAVISLRCLYLYLTQRDEQSFASAAGLTAVVTVAWFSFAVLLLTSLFGFLLTVIIGNFGWLIAVLFTTLVFYSVINHGKKL